MTENTLSERINREFLTYVQKPNRYTGVEKNRVIKQKPELTWALGFPDLYEIGMSHLGLAILYHVINNTLGDSFAAERVFLPDEQAAERLRQTGIPLFTLESKKPLRECDILGISLGYELSMPGILEMLDLAGISKHTEDRRENDPIVILGGPVVFNPEPMVPFTDLFVIGDGEEIVGEISRQVLQAKKLGLSRSETLSRLAQLEGIYYPAAFHLVDSEGVMVVSKSPGKLDPPLILGRTIGELKAEFYPHAPLLPLLETAHDRVAIEVMRGCTRGCRFCHAGMVYRPVRERPVSDVVEQAIDSIAATGYEEISFLSLSTSDYSPLPELMSELQKELSGSGISLSFPSLRPDSFTREMAEAFPEGRRGGLTFAPEAGTQRLRDVINKNSREEDLLRACDLGFEMGYTSIKLYFMIGLPTETVEDLDGIYELATSVAKLRRKKSQKMTVSISPFVPKAHTPFQWFSQETPDQLKQKISYLRTKFRNSPVRFTAHNPETSLFERVLARGDRRIGQVIEKVWKSGGVLEAWSDRFQPGRWYDALNEAGIDPDRYANELVPGKPLPWAHISKGLTGEFLLREWKRAQKTRVVPDCREGKCDACGLNQFIPESGKVCNTYRPLKFLEKSHKVESSLLVDVAATLRICYSRNELLRWTGHLDILRMWGRWLRRSQIPVAFTQGFHPHPRISFGLPLPVGCTSSAEYVDLSMANVQECTQLAEQLIQTAPEGISLIAMRQVEGKGCSWSGSVDSIIYRITLPERKWLEECILPWFDQDEYLIRREKKGKTRIVDLRKNLEMHANSPDFQTAELHFKITQNATARLSEIFAAWNVPVDHDYKPERRSVLVRQDEILVDPLSFSEAGDTVLSRYDK